MDDNGSRAALCVRRHGDIQAQPRSLRVAPPVAAFAAALCDDLDVLDDHLFAGHRFDHVPHGQEGDRDGRQGLHLSELSPTGAEANVSRPLGNKERKGVTTRRTSTPVPPVHSAVAWTLTQPPAEAEPSSTRSNSKPTSTDERLIWWQSGMRSLVRFAAMMPARCATASASPFLLLDEEEELGVTSSKAACGWSEGSKVQQGN